MIVMDKFHVIKEVNNAQEFQKALTKSRRISLKNSRWLMLHNAEVLNNEERQRLERLFAFTQPLKGVRHVSVREHRTATDWAEEIKTMVDEWYPDAERITLVMDNLNTHEPASLYKKFPAPEARRILKKLDIHYTPKHGSWLDMAEIELNVMTRQCLSRRIADIETLRRELSSWESDRNSADSKIVWQFQTKDARVKLASLYPKIVEC